MLICVVTTLVSEVKGHKRQLSDSTSAVQKSDKDTAASASEGGGLEPFDVIIGGAPPVPNADTKDATSPGGGIEEAEGRSSGRSPGTEYEATRRLM